VEFEKLKVKIKDSNTRVEKLHSVTLEKQNRIKVIFCIKYCCEFVCLSKDSQARLELARKEINKAKDAMKPHNLPVVGQMFKE